MKFVVESYNFVGDIMLDMPLFRAIVRNGHRLEVIAGEKVASMLDDCPFIDAVYLKNRNWVARFNTYWSATSGGCDVLLGGRYYTRYKVLKALGRIEIWRDESSMLPKCFREGTIMYRLSMLEGLIDDWRGEIDPTLPIMPSRYENAFRKAGVRSNEMYLTIAPGSSSVEKRWPLRNFAEVANSIGKSYSKILIVGSPDEKGLCSELASIVDKAGSMAGNLSLLETCALVSRAGQHLGNDSGLGHVAAGNGVSVVAVGGNASGHYAPWRQTQITGDVASITTDRVYASLLKNVAL